MPIKTNMTNMTPRRQQYKREITLLSKGHTSPQAWPKGKITVFPWDHTIDNFFLEENRRGASKNELLFTLVEKLTDLNGAPIDDFPADEVNTVLMVARSIGHEKVTYKTRCPLCNCEMTESISVPDELEKVGEKPEEWPGYDEITLPDCKDVVQLRILTVKDEKIVQNRKPEQRREISDSDLRTLMPIVSINESTPDTMEELQLYFSALSPADATFLIEQQRQLSPHLNTSIPEKCDDCKHQFVQVLSFDRIFFR